MGEPVNESDPTIHTPLADGLADGLADELADEYMAFADATASPEAVR